MRIHDSQKLIEAIYFQRDSARGLSGTHMWFCEEVGELTRALRRNKREELEGEFADVYAWLSTLASKEQHLEPWLNEEFKLMSFPTTQRSPKLSPSIPMASFSLMDRGIQPR